MVSHCRREHKGSAGELVLAAIGLRAAGGDIVER